MKDTSKLFALFKEYAYGHNYAIAFEELLDHFLLPFKYYESKEEQQQTLAQFVANKREDSLVAVLSEIGELSEGFEDPIGTMYEKLISKGQHGQFFSPEHVAGLIAACAIGEHTKPGQTVCDPACGSGRMLLAAAKINRHLLLYGADIDLLCCKMAVANMLLNSLSGEIAHMDSLSNTFYRGYRLGTVILKDGYHYPYYVEFTDPEESVLWKRPLQTLHKTAFDTPFNPTRLETHGMDSGQVI
ncbi:N-6 DNA methylase [Mucilaginibacter sp. AK015]|uniref:N-6 DNA methylase n=1 Tax=Mucilaginibacter sp. AK015 TaxID=2723072 RepID=UPI001621B431|nr:N-6 DNA methylase [Mucilaginibacter sp. AK015]MBB5397191.1 type I restriction-modification system DNA methylase subunit [Mucilaginibacter sp. AK015]